MISEADLIASRHAFEMGVAAHVAGNFSVAEAFYRSAIKEDPGSIDPRLNLGLLLRMLGRPGEARCELVTAMALSPDRADVRSALALAHLTLGDFAAGWPLYESRRQASRIVDPALPIPEWDGSDPSGARIVVFPEQGLGDGLLFSRFARDLRDRGAQVLLLTRPPLTSLIKASFDDIEVQAMQGQIVLGRADAWVLLASLPYKLGVTLESLSDAPYLRLPKTAERTDADFRIGLALSGNPRNLNNARRNLPLETAKRLAELAGVRVVSLQQQDTGARDFADTASIVATLDLVISVDTAIAHLAGGLGVPTIIMLPGYGADWRYLTEREDSPWYGCVRLIRGSGPDGWASAIEELLADVSQRQARAASGCL